LTPRQVVKLEAAIAALTQRSIANNKKTIDARRIEAEAERDLTPLIDKLVNESTTTGAQVQDLKLKHGNEVTGEIRSAVEAAYMTGAEYVGRATGEKNIFQSTNNSRRIGEITDNVEQFFWRQVDTQIRKVETQAHAEQVLTPEQYDQFAQASPLMGGYGTDTAAGLVANMAVFPALALGQFDKGIELKGSNPDFALQTWQVIYVSMEDEKVCAYCAALDYRHSDIYYEFRDPNIPVPRYDTHPNCRCEWWLVIDGEIKYRI
jgi:hypothetical protein